MSEPEKKKPDAPPPPPPPSAATLLEQGLVGLVDAPGVMARLGTRPAPPASASLIAGAAWGVVFFGLNVAHAAASGAAARFAAFPAWQYAAVGAAALGAWVALLLLCSSALYALARALGGTSGDFGRALELSALVAASGAFQALGAFVPVLWFLPLAAAAWIASCGLIALFGAGPAASRAACALLAALGLAAQYGAGAALAGAAARLPAEAVEATADFSEIQKQLEQAQAQAEAPPAAPGGSGLDLLRGPGEAGGERELTLAERKALVDNMRAQGDAMNKSVLAMLDSMMPMLKSAGSAKNMTAAQRADYAELTKLMDEMRTSLAENKPMSPQQHGEQMLKIQRLSMRMMAAGLAAPAPGAAPAEPKR